MTTCLNCGKPLGSGSTCCYHCQGDRAAPTVSTEVRERVERYFILSSLKCANCDEIHGTVTVDGARYTAAYFSIETIEEWNNRMQDEEEWLRANKSAVEDALIILEPEWPQTVAAVRSHIL